MTLLGWSLVLTKSGSFCRFKNACHSLKFPNARFLNISIGRGNFFPFLSCRRRVQRLVEVTLPLGLRLRGVRSFLSILLGGNPFSTTRYEVFVVGKERLKLPLFPLFFFFMLLLLRWRTLPALGGRRRRSKRRRRRRRRRRGRGWRCW